MQAVFEFCKTTLDQIAQGADMTVYFELNNTISAGRDNGTYLLSC